MYRERKGTGGGTPNLAAARVHQNQHHTLPHLQKNIYHLAARFHVGVVLTHDVSDGPAIGEPPGGEAGLVVDAIPRVVALGDGEEQVIVVPHVRHRVAENVDHRRLLAYRCCRRRRHWCRSSAGDCRMRDKGNCDNRGDGKTFHC